MIAEPRVVYEFGPFRMDPDRQTLHREGQPIPITPKAFETLLALVRRSHEVVLKEELLKEVWPDSFVEESNLSQNIFLLRRALGDTPENRQYIVTLPGRGYRFATPVRIVREQGEALVAQARTRTEIVIEENEEEPVRALKTLPDNRKPSFLQTIWLSITILAVLLALFAFLSVRRFGRVIPKEKDSVLVADFVNTTGDPVFDDSLRQGMQVELEQSPSLRLISADRIRQALGLMGKSADASLTLQNARDVCERTASYAVLEGSVKPLGSGLVLNLQAVNCQTGESIYDQQIQVARKEDALDAVTKMARGFRRHFGESIDFIQSHDTALADATTPSLEALKAYSLGWKIAASQGAEPALVYFQQSVRIDPRFAMAYASLALMYGSSGSSQLATENITRAYELRDRISDKERFFITVYYLGRAAGNEEKAQQVCQQWARTYPLEFLPHSFLAGFIDPVLANYQGAVEEAKKTIELSPDSSLGYYLLGYSSLDLNDSQGAEKAVQMATERKTEQIRLATLRFDLAFWERDEAGMRREMQMAHAHPETQAWILDRQAFAQASQGRLRDAIGLSRQAAALAQQGGQLEQATLFEVRAALAEAFFGSSREAKQLATAALAMPGNRESNYGAALALALSGQTTKAAKLAEDMEKLYPDDTSVRFSYLPVIRAAVALQHGNLITAINAVQASAPYELGSPRSSQTAFFGALYPLLFRGEALLAAHKGTEAAAEFQTILAHRGIMVADPALILAQVGLARAYTLTGESSKARLQYEQLFTQWENGDPDSPLIKQTKAEYAKLND